jgi:hypothetical protein
VIWELKEKPSWDWWWCNCGVYLAICGSWERVRAGNDNNMKSNKVYACLYSTVHLEYLPEYITSLAFAIPLNSRQKW